MNLAELRRRWAELGPRTRLAVSVAGPVLLYLILNQLPGTGSFIEKKAPAGIVVQGIVFGTLTGLGALGLVLIYRANRFINFAHAALGSLVGVIAIGVVRGDGFVFTPRFPFLFRGFTLFHLPHPPRELLARAGDRRDGGNRDGRAHRARDHPPLQELVATGAHGGEHRPRAALRRHRTARRRRHQLPRAHRRLHLAAPRRHLHQTSALRRRPRARAHRRAVHRRGPGLVPAAHRRGRRRARRRGERRPRPAARHPDPAAVDAGVGHRRRAHHAGVHPVGTVRGREARRGESGSVRAAAVARGRGRRAHGVATARIRRGHRARHRRGDRPVQLHRRSVVPLRRVLHRHRRRAAAAARQVVARAGRRLVVVVGDGGGETDPRGTALLARDPLGQGRLAHGRRARADLRAEGLVDQQPRASRRTRWSGRWWACRS